MSQCQENNAAQHPSQEPVSHEKQVESKPEAPLGASPRDPYAPLLEAEPSQDGEKSGQNDPPPNTPNLAA